MVKLLQESLLDVFTDDTGVVELGRKGGLSLAKQVLFIFHAEFGLNNNYVFI